LQTSRGSAPVEFILVGVPLVLLTLSVLGVAINSYATNIAQDVAIQAATYAALADTDVLEAQRLAENQLKLALGEGVQVDVSVARLGTPCESKAIVNLTPANLGFIVSKARIEEVAIEVCEIQF
jgi:Flp pilus assembly protein TadG